MPLMVSHHYPPESGTTRVFRVVDSDTFFYFDVYFVQGPFDNSHLLTAFVDPVGYNELNQEGQRLNLPPAHFQVSPVRGRQLADWIELASGLVENYLEYRRTGTHRWLIRQMDPEFSKSVVDPVPEPYDGPRVSRYERDPVI